MKSFLNLGLSTALALLMGCGVESNSVSSSKDEQTHNDLGATQAAKMDPKVFSSKRYALKTPLSFSGADEKIYAMPTNLTKETLDILPKARYSFTYFEGRRLLANEIAGSKEHCSVFVEVMSFDEKPTNMYFEASEEMRIGTQMTYVSNNDFEFSFSLNARFKRHFFFGCKNVTELSTVEKHLGHLLSIYEPTPEAEQPASKQPASSTPNFTKQQCLAQNPLNLGRFSSDLIDFSPDCKDVRVLRGEAKWRLSTSWVNGLTAEKVCDSFASARLVFSLSNSALEITRFLQQLNPHHRIYPHGAPQPLIVTYRPQSNGNKMDIPILNTTGLQRPAGKEIASIAAGSVSVAVDLDQRTTCRYFRNILQEPKDLILEQELVDFILREFEVEMHY